MIELIATVDKNDNITGYAEKLHVHKTETLHRAFSVFIYDPETDCVLIQRRAFGKYHSGGLLSNACCSHLRQGETMDTAVQRCLKHELGVSIPELYITSQAETNDKNAIIETGSFEYLARFHDMAEHEIDHVLVYPHRPSRIDINHDEVEEILYIPVDELISMTKSAPERFTQWFLPAFELAVGGMGRLRQ